MKVDRIWDHASAHTNTKVSEFLEGVRDWLKIELIPVGLTSVLQICDLIINKVFKQYFRYDYCNWRTQFVKDKRSEGVIDQLKIKIPRDILIDIIEKTVKNISNTTTKTNNSYHIPKVWARSFHKLYV